METFLSVNLSCSSFVTTLGHADLFILSKAVCVLCTSPRSLFWASGVSFLSAGGGVPWKKTEILTCVQERNNLGTCWIPVSVPMPFSTSWCLAAAWLTCFLSSFCNPKWQFPGVSISFSQAFCCSQVYLQTQSSKLSGSVVDWSIRS